MGQRHWKGPWLSTSRAMAYCGLGRDEFERLHRLGPTLTQARRRKGEGERRKHYIYPIQALDFAMNVEAPR